MARPLLTFLLLCFFMPLQAAPTEQDYAYQAVLSEADQPLQRVELPVEVMITLTRSDLGDIAVFNVNGKLLPHSITRTPATVDERMQELPFHEFDRYLRQHSKTVTTREQNQQSGSISELETTETIAVESVHRDYLIELPVNEKPVNFDRIELQWEHQPANQLLELKVEAGNELDRLRVIRHRKSLTNRDSQDDSWRSLRGVPQNNKYLRLTPINKIESFELLKVTGHYREQQAPPKLSYRLETGLVTEEDNKFYYFKLPSVVNAESMRIIPADAHSVISGDLYATWGKLEQKQRIRYGFRQHNIIDPEVNPSKPINLPQRSITDVWLSSNTDLSAAPAVELIYPQYEVIFLGDGNGPYRLAWGNYRSEARVTELAALLNGNLSQAQRRGTLVKLGSVELAGGPSRLSAQPALPWQKWLLWALLILAAIVTGRMAYRLYREMNAQNPT